jgi:hypothetical protein
MPYFYEDKEEENTPMATVYLVQNIRQIDYSHVPQNGTA